MTLLSFIYKAFDALAFRMKAVLSYCVTYCSFRGNNVSFANFKTRDYPFIMVARNAKGIKIGKDFSMNNGLKNNPIGCPQKCTLWCGNGASITIGENVGISQTALISHCSITIGNNVKIGGGTCVYTTDFHSLDSITRASKDDLKHRKCAPVNIEDNVFIGAKCIILKGVTIGENSIVGAGSVVTKSIPANQIWGGNPAKYIRDV